ncbi:YdiU family protein [Polynucleobacter sp. JS-Polo-80-F4]|uniref:protein adenylyltransferase SelO n=1 Tax=Polynucleobacter sp. JS-Polo-80-F4 TaxID=2576918 RepID=UPI001C0C5A16|nr:YdiU family protein [Polynucleobacter sp. JS-Polo-80-F4]MBU3617453.1 YdiU family protein [Polynucleobacter sp. JS-Polo-80-F4]
MAFTLSGDDVCQATLPTPVPDPYWVAFSTSSAKLAGIPLDDNNLPADKAWLEVLSGNQLDAGDHHFSNPIATVYSGHQFGAWAGQLGDGRAILLGDIAGQELQLKGAGKTRFSRMGDGRAVLRSSIREFLASEAMHGLGIPTTRALSIVGSDLPVRRETLETAAVCARIAPSFIRVGHFEHFASLQKHERLKELADLLIQDHYPECLQTKDTYLDLFKRICKRNAKLVAQWQAVGFCHGVLNSDNISVLGLTIDYGPFGFLDQFQIDHICNHSDQGGRYAYHRQPQVMHWNMACLASAMIPLVELQCNESEAQEQLRKALEEFPISYAQAWQSLFRKKLGFTTEQDGDIALLERLLQAMHDSKVDFTNFFRRLGGLKMNAPVDQIEMRDDFVDRNAIDQWFSDYLARLGDEFSNDLVRQNSMNQVNPKYVLRNHLAQVAIELAQKKDFSEVGKLLNILTKPFDEQPEHESYALAPHPNLDSIEVSCSS